MDERTEAYDRGYHAALAQVRDGHEDARKAVGWDAARPSDDLTGLNVERLAEALAVVSPLTPPDNFTRYSEAAAAAMYHDIAERLAARYAALARLEPGERGNR